MQVEIEEAVRSVMENGNGSSVLLPLAGGGALKVSYLWGKLGVAFCDRDGKIHLPAPRVGGSRISLDAETEMGEGAATPPPPVQVALPGMNLGLAEDRNVDTD